MEDAKVGFTCNFGGFGNNYVDHGEVKRFRSYYSFPGLELNETLWRSVDGVRLTATTFAGCYRQLAEGLPTDGPLGDYLMRLREAMLVWTGLFGEEAAEEDLVARALVSS